MQGIYQIRNIKSGKIYIGSSSNIEKRWERHQSLLRNKKHHSYKLQLDYDREGLEAFEFKILAYCELSEMMTLENKAIHSFRAVEEGYNILRNASTTLGNRLPQEVRDKISKALKGRIISNETRAKISKALKGRMQSEEHKNNIKKNRVYLPHTTATKAILSKKNKGRVFGKDFRDKVSKGLKGIRKSETARLNMSKAGLKRDPSTFRHHIWTEEEKENHSKIMKEWSAKNPMSEETKKKISEKGMGRKMSEEQHVRLSLPRKPLSEEHKKKISETKKKKAAEYE